MSEPIPNSLSEFRKHAGVVTAFFVAVCDAVGIDRTTKMKVSLGGQDEPFYETSIEDAIISLSSAGKALDGMEVVTKGSANLLAATTALLEALEGAVLEMEHHDSDGIQLFQGRITTARIAIAKANGKEGV